MAYHWATVAVPIFHASLGLLEMDEDGRVIRHGLKDTGWMEDGQIELGLS